MSRLVGDHALHTPRIVHLLELVHAESMVSFEMQSEYARLGPAGRRWRWGMSIGLRRAQRDPREAC